MQIYRYSGEISGLYDSFSSNYNKKKKKIKNDRNRNRENILSFSTIFAGFLFVFSMYYEKYEYSAMAASAIRTNKNECPPETTPRQS